MFLRVWNATPFPKEKTREAVPVPSFVHSTLPDLDAQANWLQLLRKASSRLRQLSRPASKSTQKEYRKWTPD